MGQLNLEWEKSLTAEVAVKMVKNDMSVGLGSGSTSHHMIKKLGKRVQQGLSITAVPSSKKSGNLAQSLGIPLSTLDKLGQLDINIDGADEFDSKFRLIKGGGGALLREKILAHNAIRNVIIADSGKRVDKLGKFKLPLETIPFATRSIVKELQALSLRPVLRQVNGTPYRTDENNCILDIDIAAIEDVEQLNLTLLQIPGVVETGLFLTSTDIVITVKGNEVVTHSIRE